MAKPERKRRRNLISNLLDRLCSEHKFLTVALFPIKEPKKALAGDALRPTQFLKSKEVVTEVAFFKGVGTFNFEKISILVW